MYPTRGYAALSAKGPLQPFSFQRREPGPADVQIEIEFCGVCHSDVHIARNEWGATQYPCVPGHEIVGRVVKLGGIVKKFKIGDPVAVGCLVDSCRKCKSCKADLEQFCTEGATFTYNSHDKQSGGLTYGGYSQNIVVDQNYVFRLSKKQDLAASAPLLCAGITTYSPLRRWKVGKGSKVGVIGLGGLGHMALKFAHAFGAEVTLFTRSAGKRKDAFRLGADEVIVSKDGKAMEKQAKRFDFVIDTVSAKHDLNACLGLLRRDGVLVLVGIPAEPIQLNGFSLIVPRRQFAGSLIGGIAETQEMLDFCARRNIACEIERIRLNEINQAYERMLKSDVRYRFVIEVAKSW